VTEGTLLWTPGPERTGNAIVTRFRAWVAEHRDLRFASYEELWQWSVSDLEGFWSAVWSFFEVTASQPYREIVSTRAMPGARWFTGARLNYAEHALRQEAKTPDAVAVVHSSELRALQTASWRELGDAVRAFATGLRALGVGPGDTVAAYTPTILETVVAMQATTAIGAVWSSAAPEFGARTVIDRFAQIRPKVLLVADGYRYAGNDYDRTAEIRAVLAELPTVQHVIWLPYARPDAAPAIDGAIPWSQIASTPAPERSAFVFEQVESSTPLWVLYSSGTTGLPKAIVHSHAGIVLETLKGGGLAQDLAPGQRMFFYTTTGWMMFNALVGALLSGAAIVLYDGHPAHPGPELLWRLAAEAGATTFGASPTFVQLMRKAGIVPRELFDLSALRGVLLTGSPVTPESTAWFYESINDDIWVNSPSGGTELCAAIVGGSPLLPVYAGEIQCRALGMDAHAWDAAGNDVTDQVGELVITSPAPSMPLHFQNDPGDIRYRDTYFSEYPGVWRHGDFIKLNARGGAYIYGRSDATLNRYGVRIGSSEIYRAVETLPEVADSLVVCLELRDGEFFMPLFVRLAAGCVLDDELRARIVSTLRTECSPRHVPDEIIEAPSIPYTLTGKKMEIPVRRIIAGTPPERAASRDAMMDPSALGWYVKFAAERGVLSAI
jgi:acetoacetyl-CoA synthetase